MNSPNMEDNSEKGVHYKSDLFKKSNIQSFRNQ